MNEGTGWVFGALLGIMAIALIIAGATGHASQLFQGVTGKQAGSSSSSSSPSSASSAPANTDQAVLDALQGIGTAASSSSSSSGGTTANPYSGLSNIPGTTV